MDFSAESLQQARPIHRQSPPLEDTFDGQPYQRSRRLRPIDIVPAYTDAQRNKHLSLISDSTTSRLNKRTSRFGLGGLFGKSKTNLVEDQREKLETQWEGIESVQRPQARDPGVPRPNRQASPSLEISALPEIEDSATSLRQRSSKVALRTKSSFKKERSGGKPIPWSPPPLFQAYPQAVKHATLHVPSLSAEAILKINSETDTATHQRLDSYTTNADTAKPQKERKSKRPKILDVLSKTGWVHKVFVLATSGYVLQYAGDGSYDRLPEKIMPLSKDSAAFASDAIPGKPYVLQISQVSDDEGTLDTEASRSLFKKLGIRIDLKRSTSCFLLVLESPEDMSAWLVTVRKEIEAMGGKEYKPDEFHRPATRDAVPRLQQRPNQRYLVKRDPNRFAEKSKYSPTDNSFGEKIAPNDGSLFHGNIKYSSQNGVDMPSSEAEGDWVNIKSARRQPFDRTSATANRQSFVTQSSMETRSPSNTTASINQVYLDGLRESPRQSYASTSAKTVATSRDSSPGPSPAKYHSDTQDWTIYPYDYQSSLSTDPANARMWIAPTPSPVDNESALPNPASTSTQSGFEYKPQHRRTASPAVPNFSVPSASKRFSSMAASPTISTPHSIAQSSSVTLREPPSPAVISEDTEIIAKPASIEELRHLRNSVAPQSVWTQDTGPLPTPPHSSGSHDNQSSTIDRPYSKRFSSLEYARGISPLRLPTPTTAPYPPPAAPLPSVPPSDRSSRTWLIPTPKNTPPPESTKANSRYSMLPPATKYQPTLPVVRPSSSSSATPLPSHSLNSSLTQQPCNGSEKFEFVHGRRLRRPVTVKVRKESNSNDPLPPLPSTKEVCNSSTRPPLKVSTSPTILEPAYATHDSQPLAEEQLPPKSTYEAPPPPTHSPPPPPVQRPPLITRKSSPRTGREPPPVSSPTRSRISITSPAESYFDGPAPHPFIPPIKVSERKFRGSLDGPWNIDYTAPHRTFFDLSVG